jgi:hypothetical protein
MAEEKFIHGYKVAFEKDAEDGIRYLDDKLDSECAKVFFVYAHDHDLAPFKDQNGRKYELSYEKEVYMLNKLAY